MKAIIAGKPCNLVEAIRSSRQIMVTAAIQPNMYAMLPKIERPISWEKCFPTDCGPVRTEERFTQARAYKDATTGFLFVVTMDLDKQFFNRAWFVCQYGLTNQVQVLPYE